ncbi:MAG: DUF480 domain-containing protein [Desulfobulbaceae bacterium]|nr:DUF480 domain-containing protein [Desulfobulbaceae bacterium]
MDILLTDDEVRLLGSLMEKEMATPDHYPLSLNALKNACNQKSNRNPVVSFDEETVLYSLKGLLERKIVRKSTMSRVAKYEQVFTNEVKLVAREEAVICILLLRGPQTIGEIRGRTERLFAFDNLDDVQQTLSSLEEMELVSKLPRQPGRKESRYTHLLSGEPQEISVDSVARAETDTVIVRKKNDQQIELQEQIDSLRQELQSLQLEFETFKSQFD